MAGLGNRVVRQKLIIHLVLWKGLGRTDTESYCFKVFFIVAVAVAVVSQIWRAPVFIALKLFLLYVDRPRSTDVNARRNLSKMSNPVTPTRGLALGK